MKTTGVETPIKVMDVAEMVEAAIHTS
jgi:hypothetical protein